MSLGEAELGPLLNLPLIRELPLELAQQLETRLLGFEPPANGDLSDAVLRSKVDMALNDLEEKIYGTKSRKQSKGENRGGFLRHLR